MDVILPKCQHFPLSQKAKFKFRNNGLYVEFHSLGATSNTQQKLHGKHSEILALAFALLIVHLNGPQT